MELNKPKKTVHVTSVYPNLDSLKDLGSLLDVRKQYR
jgi:hypothetical protein